MQLFENLGSAILKHSPRNAFLINTDYYTYADLARSISEIRKAVCSATPENEKNIGLVANDDLETYAAIIALWLEGKAYVPLSPENPKDRNESIIAQAFINTIIDSSATPLFTEYNLIESTKLEATEMDLIPKVVSDDELVYILFTSGTTGQPKGVPITRANLIGFVDAFWDMGFEIDADDKCLQMFELTFDLSVMSYLIPMLRGACQYTIPKDKIKYSYIFELMEDYELTFALMVPSMLHFLRPYFKEIDLPLMRYSLFCGEALPLDITGEWSRCLPNAKIMNVYGPTEDTIFCTHYTYSRTSANKSHNGVLSIGKAMKGNSNIIIDENNNLLPSGTTGQLCLGGVQLTPGYWHNEAKNKEAFFHLNVNGTEERFYKTGDLCQADDEGDLLYLGRLDYQIKVQGFRVELSEIEFHVKAFLEKTNVVAVALLDAVGNTELGLVMESQEINIEPLQEYMKVKMPAYMIPRLFKFIDVFPLNANGKTDRKKLELLFKTN
jgi:D-alanine--poly(phosphoribitol) ligase subunit 1